MRGGAASCASRLDRGTAVVTIAVAWAYATRLRRAAASRLEPGTSTHVSKPISRGSSCVSGGYSKMHERRAIIPSLEPGFGGSLLPN